MTGGEPLREAVWADVEDLVDLERRTNTVALGHVFDPARHRFPEADVRLRWERLVEDPATRVVVAAVPPAPDGGADGGADGGPGRARPVGVVSVGDDRVGHLLVEPERWGTGLGTRLLRVGTARLRATGTRRAELTCLVANARARAFYEREGWHEVGPAGRAPWPPYPRQLTYALVLAPSRADGVGGDPD